MRTALPRYIQMLHQKLQARSMAGTDKIVWREFKEYLNASPQWFATQDIPTFLSLLIAFARAQLAALTEAEELNTTQSHKRPATAAFTQHTDKRQGLEKWGAQVAAAVSGGPDTTNDSSPSCSFCGRHHSLDQCRGVQNPIAQHKQKQLNRAGPSTGKSYSRGGSTRHFQKPPLFAADMHAATFAAGVGAGEEAAEDCRKVGAHSL